MSLRALALAAICLLPLGIAPSAAEDGETRITVKMLIRAVRIRPSPSTGNASHEFSISLQPSNTVAEQYAGGGRFRANNSRVVPLGPQSSEASVTYRVLGASTIQRIANYQTYVSTITISVTGRTCSATYKATLKPGHREFVAYSQELGVMASYSSFTLASATCEIS